MANWNGVFWIVYAVMGALVLAGIAANVIYIDIILGLFVIGIGASKLCEEIAHRKLQSRHSAINESLSYLTRQVDSTTLTAEHLRDSNDSRFFRLDHALKEFDEKLENRFDGAVKKVISLENRINEHSKLMLEIARRQEALKAAQATPKPAETLVVQKPAYAPLPASTVPEKRIIRFELPKIAPRKPAKKKPSKRKPKAAAATIINIQAPKPRVIKVRAPAAARPALGRGKGAKALKTRKAKKESTKNISINIG